MHMVTEVCAQKGVDSRYKSMYAIYMSLSFAFSDIYIYIYMVREF